MADKKVWRGPDYEFAEELALTDDEQYRALFDQTRKQIVQLLRTRAATTSELAQALDKPKGTVGHHLKVLESAGLVRVVRTERVRALEAKYYGRTARIFLYENRGDAVGEPQRILARAAAEIAEAPGAADSTDAAHADAAIRYSQVAPERVHEFRRRLTDLLAEFADEPISGTTTHAMVFATYPTRRPGLPDDRSRAGEHEDVDQDGTGA